MERRGGRNGEAERLLKSLYEFTFEIEQDPFEMPLDRVNAELQAAGVDVKPLIEQAHKAVAATRREEAFKQARTEREEFAKRLGAHRATANDRSRAEMINLLVARQSSGTEQAAVYFRKLEEATDEDLRRMIDDLELLDGEERKGNDV